MRASVLSLLCMVVVLLLSVVLVSAYDPVMDVSAGASKLAHARHRLLQLEQQQEVQLEDHMEQEVEQEAESMDTLDADAELEADADADADADAEMDAMVGDDDVPEERWAKGEEAAAAGPFAWFDGYLNNKEKQTN